MKVSSKDLIMKNRKDNIKILPEIINKNGFSYILVTRTQNKAMYKQTNDNIQVGFEVFLIRVRGTHFSPFLNKSFDTSERFPGNEDFGKSAWSFMDYQKAFKKYDEL